MKKFFYILLTWLLCLHTTALSQNPEWINYTNNDEILSMKMDGDNIWIGTTVGLVKLNKNTGDKMFYNKLNSSLPSNWISCINIDKNGTLWLGTREGLVTFDGTNWMTILSLDSVVNDIEFDKFDNIWIGTDGGLLKFDGSNWITYNTSNSGLPSNFIQCIKIDIEGNKWIGTGYLFDQGAGIAKFDGENWEVYNTLNSGLPSNHIRVITSDDSGNLWAGTPDGIAKFDGLEWTKYYEDENPISFYHLYCMGFDHEGILWVGTLEVIAKYKNGKWELIDGLLNNYGATSFLFDDTRLWLGACTYEGFGSWSGNGLFHLDGSGCTKIDISDSQLPHSGVIGVRVDNNNSKWLFCGEFWKSTCGESLVEISGNTWTIYDTTNSELPGVSISDIAFDNNNNKWVCTGSGLAKFNGGNWLVHSSSNSGLPTNSLSCITIDDNNIKWIGTGGHWRSGAGIVKYNGEDWEVYNTTNSGLPTNSINCITIDKDNNKWIGTEGQGVVKYDGSNWEIFNFYNVGLPSNYIKCITIDLDGIIWIGTGDYLGSGGLVKFDGTNWVRINKSNTGLPDWINSVQINCVEVDNFNNKWIGTFSRGLVYYDNSEWKSYNESNSGLVDNFVASLAIDKNGNKWIGTWNGLAVITESGVVSVDEKDKFRSLFPNNFQLSQNYPNPFNPSTKIKYSIPRTANVVIKVFDILGKEIETLVNEEKTAGTYELTWTIANQPSGVYFYRIQAGDFIQTKKMILLK